MYIRLHRLGVRVACCWVMHNNKIRMYPKHKLGPNSFSDSGYLPRDVVLNTRKSEEFAKSEVQMNKMTHLLKQFNTENEFLNKQVIKLFDQNKELKTIINRQSSQKQPLQDLAKKTDSRDFAYRWKNRKEAETSEKVVVVHHGLVHDNDNIRQTGSSVFSQTARFQPSQSQSKTREYKFTQTSPARANDKPITDSIGISTTPQKPPIRYASLAVIPNPQSSIKRKQKPQSVHKLEPKTSMGIRQPSLRFSQGRIVGCFESGSRNTLVEPRKRFLSLVSLGK